jgi:AraC-like DNA-binding protein
MRQYAIDAVLVSIARLARQISGAFRPELELRFDCAQPAHFERYRHRLPPVVFNAGANQLRFPADYLQRPMPTGNASAAQVLADACERELALIGEVSDVAERVRAQLVASNGGYPDLDAVAKKLHVSGRTLKRKLQQQGVSFLQLLDDARRRDSQKLLSDPALTVAAIAEAMGYTDPASFTRAFRKWAGVTPSAWREKAGR